jgi:Flp pilus assembly protein TadD
MRRAVGVAWLAWALAGCSPALQERVRSYNEDGLYLFQQGDYAGACQVFQAAAALQPGDAALWYNIGECFDRLGDTAKAEEAYGKCLQKAPDHVRCRHALAALLVRTNRRKQAVFMIEDWLAREPKRPDPYAEDGWLWRQAGDLPQAQARLQQALDLDAHNLRALNELALVYEELGLPERAVVLYERSLAVDPRQPDVAQRLNGLLAKGAGRPKP